MSPSRSNPAPNPPTEPVGNAVVVGGGLTGCVTTHYLLQRGFHVHLFERYPPVPSVISVDQGAGVGRLYKQADSRSYPLMLTMRAVKALEGVGLKLPPSLLKPLVGNCMHLPNGKKVRTDFSRNSEFRNYSVSRNALVSFLQQSLLQRNDQNLTAHFGWELIEISSDKTRAYFHVSKRHPHALENDNTEKGEIIELEFDLLIGADGVSSKVRSELLRLDKLHHESDNKAVKDAPMTLEFTKHPASYKSVYINPSLARQSPLFGDHDRVQSWPALNMLVVNVSDGSFWGGSQNAKMLGACSSSELEKLFRDNAPEVLDLLLKENPNFAEEFIKQPSIPFGGAVKLSRFHDNNIVVIGDAAHAMFATYAMGGNAALEDCLLFNNILAELRPTGEGKYPISIATAEFTKRRLVDAHAIVEMSSNKMLFPRGTQAVFYKTLQKWFPNLFGPMAYQLLWSDVPFSEIKAKKRLENTFFYTALAVLGSSVIVVPVLALKIFF